MQGNILGDFFFQKLLFKLRREDAKWYFKNTHLKKKNVQFAWSADDFVSEGILPEDTEKITFMKTINLILCFCSS